MRRLAHISDLHFGHEEPQLVEALLRELAAARPDLVVISGDLTERARREQFERARAFLARLPAPFLAVPGNHDVPVHEAIAPLRRYRSYITPELMPFWRDEELAVVGLSTARLRTFHRGRISTDQIRALRARLQPLPDSIFKVVVAHHPLVPSEEAPGEVVGMSRLALNAFDLYGVNLVLAGHLHQGFAGHVRTYMPLSRTIIAAHAGASASTHEPDEPNSYNLIDVSLARVVVTARTFVDGGFQEASQSELIRAGRAWRRTAIQVDAPGVQPQPAT